MLLHQKIGKRDMYDSRSLLYLVIRKSGGEERYTSVCYDTLDTKENN